MENNDGRFRKIDERMDRTDRLVDALHEGMIALEGKMSALADAQHLRERRLFPTKCRTWPMRRTVERRLFPTKCRL
jgi:hypothetical protein